MNVSKNKFKKKIFFWYILLPLTPKQYSNSSSENLDRTLSRSQAFNTYSDIRRQMRHTNAA